MAHELETLGGYLRQACYDPDKWSGGFAAVEGAALAQYGVNGYGIERRDRSGTLIWCLAFGCEDDDESKPETVVSYSDDQPGMIADLFEIIRSDFQKDSAASPSYSAH